MCCKYIAVGPASVDLTSKESQLYMAYFMAPKKEEKKKYHTQDEMLELMINAELFLFML